MKILAVDDDIQLAKIIAFTLRREGFEVVSAYDGQAALDQWAVAQPDLILLDINLPRLDGYEVLRRIRAVSPIPVILLTARGDEDDTVRGLDLGADDYVSKPFSPATLLARIRAVMRRGGLVSGSPVEGGLQLDPDRQEVRVGEAPPIKLTPLEYRLLDYLMLHRGHTLTSEALIEHVWGYDDVGDRNVLKQLVRRLRLKIEPDPAHPRYLETVSTIGYTLLVLPAAASS